MDILRSPPETREEPGLAANDSTMMFPIIGGILASAYYANQQNNLLDGYLANSEEALDPEAVVNIPLRYRDPVDGLYNYRATTVKEKQAREQAIVRLVRTISEEGTGFLGNFREINPANPAEKQEVMEKRKKGLLMPKNVWQWVKQYQITSLFLSEVPQARYLPIACLLSVIDGEGESKLFHGGLTSLIVEADKDIIRTAQPENMAIRIYGTLRDTNWRNMGTGTPKYVYFMYTQDTALTADFALLDKPIAEGGKKIPGSVVSSLALELSKQPVKFSTNVYRSIREKGLSYAVNAAYPDSVRLAYDKGSQLVYTVRALERLFPSTVDYNPDACKSVECLQVYGDLPMAVRFNDTMLKVKRVILTTDEGKYPNPDLDQNSVVTKGVMFETNLGVVYQDTPGGVWKLRDAPTLELQESTKLDLVVFSENRKLDLSKVPDNLQQSAYFFEDFDSRRYFFKSTLDERRYNSLHAEDAIMRVDSPEVKRPEGEFKVEINEYSGIALAFCILFALYTWMKPNALLAYRLGQLTALVGIVFAVLSVISFLSIRLNLIPWVQKNHDEVLYYFTLVLILLSALTVIASLRFNRAVPAGVYVMAVLLTLCIFLIRATPVESTKQLTDSMRAWRSALIIVVFKAGLLLTWESLKMGGKALATPVIPPITSGLQFTEPGTGVVLFLVLLFYPLYRMLLSADDQKCESRKVRMEWLEDQIDKGHNVQLNSEELDTLRDDEKCTGFNKSVAEFSGKAIGFVVVAVFFLYFIAVPLLSNFVKRIVPLKHVRIPMRVYESGIVTKVYHFAKLAISAGLLALTAFILVPTMRFTRSTDSTCFIADKNITSFKETYGSDVDRIFFDTDSKNSQIEDATASLGCMATESIAILGVLTFLFAIWMISLVTQPLYSLTSPVPSVVELVFFLLFCGLIAIVYVFMTERTNLRKALEIDATRVLTNITEILTPP